MDSVYTIKYFSEYLNLLSSGNSSSRIEQTLCNSRIKLNPHQIKAALFAFSSPESKGVMLCDEVGLGKTIEAGIVITQFWCERKRKIIIICPATLCRQWSEELSEKFGLSSIILDRKIYNSLRKSGYNSPFEIKDKVFIMSINFASKISDDIAKAGLDLVVIDEAHKLRNVHNSNNVIANSILNGIKNYKKILLTATPMQNNLLELYGLSLLIDDSIFIDREYFKYRFINNYEKNKKELRERLDFFVHRTLRSQVKKYVNYPNRNTLTLNFHPSKEEIDLFNELLFLIHSNPTFGCKKSQSNFIGLILCKLLSSSTAAIVQTLNTIKSRIENVIENGEYADYSDLVSDEETEDEELELDNIIKINFEQLKIELELINKCLSIADSVVDDAKAYKLLEGLEQLFSKCDIDLRNKKVIIFTESRATQNYLYNFLNMHGYNKILLFNGTNNSAENKIIYEKWLEKQNIADIEKNSKNMNMRAAILDYFKEYADIMISTEAGAEGLNLQFCSMLINYDLPWNPQRVEQRIGRCHRYGQKNDVIVINFLNDVNIVDNRVYELLKNKFNLFDDVFGSSDEILGKLDDEKNFERQIYEIYKNCRTPEEIENAFLELQNLYTEDINAELKRTRESLLDNFDEDLQRYFDILLDDVETKLPIREEYLLRIAKYYLEDYGVFDNKTFVLNKPYNGYIGKYTVLNDIEDTSTLQLRTISGLGKDLIDEANSLVFEKTGFVKFDLTNYPFKISELENIKGQTGYIILQKLSVDSFEQAEELIISGRLNNGQYLDTELCLKLFRLNNNAIDTTTITEDLFKSILDDQELMTSKLINDYTMKNDEYFNNESKRINQWADDKMFSVQYKVEELRERRQKLQLDIDSCIDSDERINLEKEISSITKKIRQMWLELADAEELIEIERQNLIKKLKDSKMKTITKNIIFKIGFIIE